MQILRDFPLHNLNTFNIGGRARYFVRAFSFEDVKDAFNFAYKYKIPVFILGGGSNILVDDAGFNGLVLKNEIENIEIEEVDSKTVFLKAGAGESWDKVVEFSIENNLAGIEALSGIPGTVGGAVVQNIGAYGADVSEVVYWIEVFDPKTFLTFKIKNFECNFSYRSSFFKTRKGKELVVLRACFRLYKNKKCKILNKEVLEKIKNKRKIFSSKRLTPSIVRETVLEIRNSKLPSVSVLNTAGSFFKNPKINKIKKENLEDFFPEIPCFECGEDEYKLSAGWLIENIGEFKGVKLNGAGVWEHHALILANYGEASACDIERLAEIITASIKNKCGITLEREVVYIGF